MDLEDSDHPNSTKSLLKAQMTKMEKDPMARPERAASVNGAYSEINISVDELPDLLYQASRNLQGSVNDFEKSNDKALDAHTLLQASEISEYNKRTNQADGDTDLGILLSENTRSMITILGDLVLAIIIYGFDIDSAYAIAQAESMAADELAANLKPKANGTFEKPDHQLVESRVKVEKKNLITKIVAENILAKFGEERKLSSLSQADVNEVNTFSPDQKWRLEMELADYEGECEADYEGDMETYQAKVKVAAESKEMLHEQTVEHESKLKHLAYLKAIQLAIRKMSSKLKVTINSVPTFRTRKMSSSVVLRATGITVHNPYENSDSGKSLSGMYQLLYDQFKKWSIKHLTMSLMELFRFRLTAEQTRDKPSAAVDYFTTKQHKWILGKIWEQMTFDYFWVVLLLNSFDPNVAIRDDIVREAMKIIRDYEAELVAQANSEKTLDLRSPTNDHSTVIFNRIADYIKEIMSVRELDLGTKLSATGKIGGGGGGGSGGKMRDINSSNAFAADDAAAATVANTTADIIPPGVIDPRNNRKYDQPVPKASNPSRQPQVWHTLHRRSIPYIAVTTLQAVCDTCFNAAGALSGQFCTSPLTKDGTACYQGKCKSCGYYGHGVRVCLQKKKTDGTPIQG